MPTGRVHSAAISGIDSGKKFISVEWFENNETKGKEVRLNDSHISSKHHDNIMIAVYINVSSYF